MSMLTTYNAEIGTATVEIKTLTVSGKQVTLAVFRQLRERPLISFDDGLTLNGNPWGVVEYHPDGKACAKGEHIHVIWSSENGIFRDSIAAPSTTFASYGNSRHGVRYVHALVRDQLSQGSAAREWSSDCWDATIGAVRVRIAIDQATKDATC
jgi:hypothetical protein